MAHGFRYNRARIVFSEIEVGDRLRVRYTEGGRENSSWMGDGEKCVSVVRTLVAEVVMSALDTVWLASDGTTVVHRDWDDLEIIRLTEAVAEAPAARSRKGVAWTAEEDARVADYSVPVAIVARQTGRTKQGVASRRAQMRAGTLPVRV